MVRRLAVDREAKSMLERRLDGRLMIFRAFEPSFEGLDLAADSILLGLEEIERYRSGVVCFEELRSFTE
ncbi:MAG TPA: hypothetical protein VGK79_16565 [Gaiellaceae bacterium]